MVNNTFWLYTFLYHRLDSNKLKQTICSVLQSLIQENIYAHLLYFYSHFLFYIHSNTLIFQNNLLRSFDIIWFSFADKVTRGKYSFMSLIVKVITSESALPSSASAAAKTQYFVLLNLNSTLQLFNGISSYLKKLLRYFNGTAILAFLEFHRHYLVQAEQLCL